MKRLAYQAYLIPLILIAVDIQYPPVAGAQVDTRLISQRLLRGTIQEKNAALEQAAAIAPDKMNLELRMALITALDREGKLHERRYQSGRRGESLEPLDDPEFIARLAPVV